MPAANYVGTDSFTYTVTDASGYTATNTVTVTVADVAPASASDKASSTANTAATAATEAQNPWYLHRHQFEPNETSWLMLRNEDGTTYNPAIALDHFEDTLVGLGGSDNSSSTSAFYFGAEVRKQLLVVRISDRSGAPIADELKILQADGEPLPAWATREPGGCLVAQVPEGVDRMLLKIVQPEGLGAPSTETFVTIYMSTGEIIAETRAPVEAFNSLPFAEQLKHMKHFISLSNN